MHYNRKLALSMARQARRCPPLSIKTDPTHTEQVKRHKSICPHCTNESLEDLAALDAIAEKIVEPTRISQKADSEPPVPGQIRYVKTEKGSWRDGYYYSPPLVVILSAEGKIADDIRVAQLYDDLMLAGPGDLILEADQTGGADDLFIECWNTYTLRASHLGTLVGAVSEAVLQAVDSLEKDPSNPPLWATLTVPMQEGDPRIHFRELEVEVAYTFSARAAAELMEVYESLGAAFFNQPTDNLKTHLTDMVPGIRFSNKTESIEDMLASTRFPDEMLPLAAADDTQKKIFGARVIIQRGQVTGIEPAGAALFPVPELETGAVGFSGQIALVKDLPPPFEILFRLELKDGSLMVPEASDYDAAAGYFTVSFADPPADGWNRLCWATLHQVDENGD